MKSVLGRYHWIVAGLSIIVFLIIAKEIVDSEGLLSTTQGIGFTRADYDKLKLGMTEKEVIEALGAPPGIYVTTADFVMHLTPEPCPGSIRKAWVSEAGAVFVDFGEKGEVTRFSFQKPKFLKESFFQRLFRILGLK
jgi:hypothetical protein